MTRRSDRLAEARRTLEVDDNRVRYRLALRGDGMILRAVDYRQHGGWTRGVYTMVANTDPRVDSLTMFRSYAERHGYTMT